MYDATSATWRGIPRDAELVGGYVDGAVIPPWPAEAWASFPDALHVKISTWGPRHNGNALDIESGDSVPSDIPDWVDNAYARGVENPILYCGVSAWDQCIRYAGPRRVQWWTAHYIGNAPHFCGPACNSRVRITADATQWADQERITGGPYDLSICSPTFAPSTV